jgi:hypothetical protein
MQDIWQWVEKYSSKQQGNYNRKLSEHQPTQDDKITKIYRGVQTDRRSMMLSYEPKNIQVERMTNILRQRIF